MMRVKKLKRTAAPIIILIDILMQFMFVSMANPTQGLEIVLPHDKLFAGGLIISKIDNKMNYFDGRTFLPIDPKKFNITFYREEACVGTICDDAYAILPKDAKVSIAIKGKLFLKLSQLTFLSCSQTDQCGHIRYDILSNGDINKTALFKYNPIFKKLSGIKLL